MCEPISMAVLGGLQAYSANQAQNQAYAWKKKMEEKGEEAAFLSNAIQQRQLGTQTDQKMRSVNEEIQMIQRKGNQVAATAAVRATKGGVQADSASVQALHQQFGKDAMQAIGVRDVEGQETLTMSQQQAKAIELQTQARIDSVQAGPAPDKGAQFLNLAMGAAQGYMMGKSMQGGITPTTPTPSIEANLNSLSMESMAGPMYTPPTVYAPPTITPSMDFGLNSLMQTPPTMYAPPTISPSPLSINPLGYNPYPIGPMSALNPYSAWGTY